MKFILQTTRKISLSVFIFSVCLFSAQTAFSQVRTWDGGGDGSTWSDAINWSGDVAPINTDSVIVIAGANVVVTSGTAVCRKLGIYGSGSSQGKVTVNLGATLTADAATSPANTNDIANGHAVISLFGGMIDNKGTLNATGRQNLDAIRFDNPTSGTLSSTYMGTGSLTCTTSAAAGNLANVNGAAAASGSNGTAMTFAQTSGTATFTSSSSATYLFTVGTTIKTVFYCARGTAKIDGTGTFSVGGAMRSIRVVPFTNSDAPNLTIESGVTMSLISTAANTGVVYLDHSSLTSASVNMTNKGILNFSGDFSHPIYLTNPSTASNTTNFTNEGTININGGFTDASNTGGINMAGANTTLGNVFTNTSTGTINFNTTGSGTSTKPLFICSIGPKNVVNNSGGTITVGTNGAPAIAIRLGTTTTTFNNTGTLTIGTGNISGNTANANFNNNAGGIVNYNSTANANSTLVIFTNTGGTFNANASVRVGRFAINNGTLAIADGTTFTTFLLTLTAGNIPLGTGNIVIESGGSVAGGSLASHIITNGTGRLTMPVTSAGAVFPIGQSASSYDPVTIKPTAAGPFSFSARVGEQTTALGTNPINSSLVVNREWDITGPTGATDLTFVSAATNKDGSSTRPSGAVGVVGHHNGTTWDAPISSAYASNTWTVTGYTGTFSPFIVAAPGSVLSVELTSFKATPLSKTNLLTWETASEINNKGFDVQRQAANGAWESLGFVNGTGKASTYAFEDKGPLSISYYRLRQIDFDGSETLSKIVSVRQDGKGRISITPNPTSDKVTINLSQNDGATATTTIILYDMTGRQVLTQRATGEAIQLDLSNLAKGMYVVTVQSNNAVYQQKIIRQ
jgi:hypothetical protein